MQDTVMLTFPVWRMHFVMCRLHGKCDNPTERSYFPFCIGKTFVL